MKPSMMEVIILMIFNLLVNIVGRCDCNNDVMVVDFNIEIIIIKLL